MATKSASTHWSNALVRVVNNTDEHIISSKLAVVIRDKFPKARHHYLILPRADIASIYDLCAAHCDILADMALLATNCIELTGQPAADFQLGYHAKPSMQRLHLHCISRDFDSPALKKREHWNGFNTEFFLPMATVHRQCAELGAVQRPSAELCKQWLARELRCHRCDYRPKNLPDLKAHIVQPHSTS